MTETKAATHIGKVELIALVAGLMALNAMAIDIMLPALPAMGEALAVAHENQRQLVLTIYLVALGVAQLAYGPLADRYGRKPPLLAGMVIYTLAAIAAVFAPNFETLLVCRFIQGLGAASTRVIAQSTVRDRFGGRAMAEVMSLVMVVFMIIPIIAPSIGQLLLFTGHWEMIFLFMAGMSATMIVWTLTRLDESLPEDRRRPLTVAAVLDGFRLVLTNRSALFYGLSSVFIMGCLFGFISTASQVFMEVYTLGALFPLAFAFVASLMAVSSFLNSRLVGRIGMRRLAHGALLVFVGLSLVWSLLAWNEALPFAAFMAVFTLIMFSFGLFGSNSMALAMEPLGAVAGTAASVFGFLQTVGGALIGMGIGFSYDGTVRPVATAFFVLGGLGLVFVLIAEKGKLFGVGEQYRSVSRGFK